MIDGWGISCEIAIICMSLDLTGDKSTLVQVMAWCRQAASHYLNQCWPRPMSPYGITRPQWINSLRPGDKCNGVSIVQFSQDLIQFWLLINWMFRKEQNPMKVSFTFWTCYFSYMTLKTWISFLQNTTKHQSIQMLVLYKTNSSILVVSKSISNKQLSYWKMTYIIIL